MAPTEAPQQQANRIGIVVAAIWILLTTGFFLLRFSTVFYQANRSVIDKILSAFP